MLGTWGIAITASAPATLTSLTANVSFPVAPGTPITWTAVASGGTAPLQYQFWRYNIATAAFGSVAAGQVVTDDDSRVMRALQVLPKAAQLAQTAAHLLKQHK